MTNKKKLHLCFDFDETITKEHKIIDGPNDYYGWEDIRQPHYLSQLLMKAYADGHLISITTQREGQNEYIKSALINMGLPDELINNIVIEGSSSNFEGKNHHIKRALARHRKSPGTEYLSLLIDDSISNIEWAKQAGHGTIEVESDHGLAPNLKSYNDTHLQKLDAILHATERYMLEHEAHTKSGVCQA